MGEISKMLKALNMDRTRICNRVGSSPLYAESISSIRLLYGIRFLLSDSAVEMGIELDPDELDREIYSEDHREEKLE